MFYQFLKGLTPTTTAWLRAVLPLLGVYLGSRVDSSALVIMTVSDVVAAVLEIFAVTKSEICLAILIAGNVAGILFAIFSGEKVPIGGKLKRLTVALIIALILAISISQIQVLVTA